MGSRLVQDRNRNLELMMKFHMNLVYREPPVMRDPSLSHPCTLYYTATLSKIESDNLYVMFTIFPLSQLVLFRYYQYQRDSIRR